MKKSYQETRRPRRGRQLLRALGWVAVWIAVALSVCAAIRWTLGPVPALEFLGGYLIELSLSMDNLFVFMSVFAAFGIPEHARHRVLHWGILGAVVLRLVFILLGAAMVERFEWVLYLFGVLLLLNGAKMLRGGEEGEQDASRGPLMGIIRCVLPMTDTFAGEKFFVRLPRHGKTVLRATPLFGVLVLIECSDIIFAIDSVPAVFSVSTHPLIVYSSNILAILGLRQMYFVLEYMADRFRYVRRGVAVILLFTGGKLLGAAIGVTVGTAASIGVIFAVLVGSIALSLIGTAAPRSRTGK